MRFLMQNQPHIRQELVDKMGGSLQIKEHTNFEKDNEYYTPKKIVKYFGDFDYDPATTEEKAKEFGITNYDTIETDGLKTDWSKYKKIWINPPFTEKQKFIEKAYQTFLENPYIYIYILFPIEFLTTKKFHKISKNVGGKIFIPSGRIPFESGLGKKGKSPAFGSVILLIQNKWDVELIDMDKFNNQLSLFD